jgi:hypothetical protein
LTQIKDAAMAVFVKRSCRFVEKDPSLLFVASTVVTRAPLTALKRTSDIVEMDV